MILNHTQLPPHDCYLAEDASANIRGWANHPRDFGTLPAGWRITTWSVDPELVEFGFYENRVAAFSPA
jgi:hypothetical protein